jgi:hypothetical protein
MKSSIGILIVVMILASGCANNAGVVKAQHQRTAMGVKETRWGQLPTYSYTIPVQQKPLPGEVFEGLAKETDFSVDLLINAEGTVTDAKVATSLDKAVAEAIRQNFLTARYAPNRDPGVTRYVTQLTFTLTPSSPRPTSIPYGGRGAGVH